MALGLQRGRTSDIPQHRRSSLLHLHPHPIHIRILGPVPILYLILTFIPVPISIAIPVEIPDRIHGPLLIPVPKADALSAVSGSLGPIPCPVPWIQSSPPATLAPTRGCPGRQQRCPVQALWAAEVPRASLTAPAAG